MVLEGLDIALLPERLVWSDVVQGELCMVYPDWRPPLLSFFERYTENRTPLFVGKAAEIAVSSMATAPDTLNLSN